MCSHHLVEPTACSPAAGWEKGQVENQVKTSRERFFTPRLRAADYDELNAILEERVVSHAKSARHPEFKERTIWEVFQEEKAALVPHQGAFKGFHESEEDRRTVRGTVCPTNGGGFQDLPRQLRPQSLQRVGDGGRAAGATACPRDEDRDPAGW